MPPIECCGDGRVADANPDLPAVSTRGRARQAPGGPRRRPSLARDVAAAAVGLSILGFAMYILPRPFMRWPSALQGTVVYFLLALSAALLYPLIRDVVVLRRLGGKWRFMAHGSVAVFFAALMVLLWYGRARRIDSGDAINLPIASINGIAAGELIPAPRHVTLRGPLEEGEPVALWWRPDGGTRWAGPITASTDRAGWQATLDFGMAAGRVYRVLAMPAIVPPRRCRTCEPLRLVVADVDAAIESLTVDGLAAKLTGTFVNPGGGYELHLLRSDSVSQPENWEDAGLIRASAGNWSATTDLRDAYHYPHSVTLRVTGSSRDDGHTVPLAERTAVAPGPGLAIRKINGRDVSGTACVVEPKSKVTVEGTAANLLDAERLWVRIESFDRAADTLGLQRVAAVRIGAANWSAKVSVGAGWKFQFEAAISESDPGPQPAAFTSAAVTCVATNRQ